MIEIDNMLYTMSLPVRPTSTADLVIGSERNRSMIPFCISGVAGLPAHLAHRRLRGSRTSRARQIRERAIRPAGPFRRCDGVINSSRYREVTRLRTKGTEVEGQPFLMVMAGLGVSLAGFSSLLTLFRANNDWDPVSLWRAKTIVRASLNVASAALVPVPVFYLTGSEQWAIRAGTAMLLALSVVSTIRSSPQKQPEAWPEGYSVVPFYVIGAIAFSLMALNLALANLGLLLLLLLWDLGLPAGIFADVVEEFRPGERLEQPIGDDGTSPADR
jgi:hypothetical protein